MFKFLRSSWPLIAAVGLSVPVVVPRAFAGPSSPERPSALTVADDKDKDKDKDKHDDKKPNPLKQYAEELDTIADLLDGLLNPDGPDAILPRIAENDRRRLTDDLTKGREKYIERVKAFRDEWHKHYDDNFNANNHKGILSADRIEVSDKDGKHTATVFFDATAGKRSFQLRLLREKDGKYALDLPDSVKGPTFMHRLDGNLKDANDSKDDWPKSQSVAYARAAHELLYGFRFEEEKAGEDKQ